EFRCDPMADLRAGVPVRDQARTTVNPMVCVAPAGSPAAVTRATSRYRPSASLRPPTTPENCQALAPARDARETAPIALQPLFVRCWTTNRVVPFRSRRQVPT